MSTAVDGPDAPATDPPRKRGGGPKTPEGKERAKRNSLRHGLMAEVIFPVDLAAAIAARTAALIDEFRPQSPYESWLVGEMAKASAKLDRCSELMIVDLQRTIDRAVLCWDGDRRVYIEDLGARLPKDPARIARALQGSKQGVDWLLERWEALGAILQTNGGWDEPQRRLAFDLLGVPAELRHGSLEVPPEGDAPALVAEQVSRLRADQESTLDALDEATRAMVTVGMPMVEVAATRRLRRYEAGARRAFHWALAELQRVRTEAPKAGEPAADSPEVPPRPYASGAARDVLAKRSKYVSMTAAETTPDEPAIEMPPVPEEVSTVAEAPAVAEIPAVAEAPPAADAPAFIPPPTRVAISRSVRLAPSPRNRRERRAQERRARQDGRYGVR